MPLTGSKTKEVEMQFMMVQRGYLALLRGGRNHKYFSKSLVRSNFIRMGLI